MDFRMDKSSWAMLLFMLVTFLYYLVGGAGEGLPLAGYFQALGFGLLTLVALVSVSCIPVLIYCYLVKMIPDIDYSIRFAFAITLVGIITQLF